LLIVAPKAVGSPAAAFTSMRFYLLVHKPPALLRRFFCLAMNQVVPATTTILTVRASNIRLSACAAAAME
jgi:hypothetical protein